ncbi:SCO4225 family membrane protein [Streptomyces sp. Act-28]
MEPIDPGNAPLRGLVRLTFGNVASGVYLAIVAVGGAVAAHDLWFTDREDASLAAVGLIAVAAPTMLVLLAGGELAGDALIETPWFFWAAFAGSVLVQSLAVGALARLAAGAPRHEPRPHGG